MAMRKHRLSGEVAGYVRRAASVSECERLGAVDHATRDMAQAVQNAELVVLCTPLSQMRGLVEQMLPALEPGTILTDVGSVKQSVVNELEPLLRPAGAHFIGSHPMAGAEKTGVAAARADLFVEAACVVTPTAKSNPGALRKVERLWKSVGGRVQRLAPRKHDLLVSRSSHLPHITAAALASLVLGPGQPKEQAALCANGFRDTTRIASGSPAMWRDIALDNRVNLDRALDSLIGDLTKFQRALRTADAKAITRFLERARDRRNAWCGRCASPSPE